MASQTNLPDIVNIRSEWLTGSRSKFKIPICKKLSVLVQIKIRFFLIKWRILNAKGNKCIFWSLSEGGVYDL